MRFKGRRVLAALVAVFALGAVASASALAAPPEFTLKTGEKFPDAITSSTESRSTGVESGFLTVPCHSNKATGEVTAAKAVSLTLEWTGCRSTGSGEPFTSEGAPLGDIVVSGTGSLVYMDEKHEAGIIYTLKETKIVEAGLKMTLSGSVLIPVTPINTETSKVDLAIDKTSITGVPEYTRYESEGEVKEAYLKLTMAGKSEGAAMYVGAETSKETFGVTASKALTVAARNTPPPLPEFVLGKGEAYPVSLEGSSPAAKVALGTERGTVSCEGVNTKGTISASRSLSSLTYELQHCKLLASEEACQTGAEAGRVVLSGSGELFYIKKAEEHVALVFALNEASILCDSGSLKVKARGTVVIRVTPVGLKTTQPTFTLTRNGEAFENTYTKYENEKSETVTTKFELNFGPGGYGIGFFETGALDPTTSTTVTVEG